MRVEFRRHRSDRPGTDGSLDAFDAQVDSVLVGALALPTSDRASFVGQACGDDEALRREVEGLLAVRASSLVRAEAPAFELISRQPQTSPRSLGPYTLEAKIGEGGTSVVYRACRTDGSDNRSVAIKLLKRGMDSDEIMGRFEREGHILSSLDDPRIARVFGGGLSEDQRPFLVMELIEGKPIDRFCRDGDLSIAQRIRLLQSACDGVAYAHLNLVVHRDLKPDNILITSAGELKILDFGLAKLLDPVSSRPNSQTVTRHRMMTPAYAAPEQLALGECTTAVDVYSLGVILFELLTGRRPFQGGESARSFVSRVLEEEAPAPSRLRRGLSADLDAIVSKALRKRPQDRYRSANDLGRDLERFLAHRPVKAQRGGLRYRVVKLVRRRRWEMALAGLLALGLVLALVYRERSRARLESERNRAVAVQDLMVDLFADLDPYLRGRDEPPSMEALLERGLAGVRSLEGVPILEATLLTSLGRIYGNRGRNEKSVAVIREASNLYRRFLPPSDRRIPETETLFGDALFFVGRHEEAEVALRRAAAFDARGSDWDEGDRTATTVSLARLLWARGHPEEAAKLFLDALAFLDGIERPGPVLRSLHIEVCMLLGSLFREMKDLERARAHAERSWRAAVSEWGPDDARSLYARGVLAQALFAGGEHQVARGHMEAVATSSKVLLGDHPDVARAYLTLGRQAMEMNQPANAETAIAEALRIFLTVQGPEGEGVRASRAALDALEGAVADPNRSVPSPAPTD